MELNQNGAAAILNFDSVYISLFCAVFTKIKEIYFQFCSQKEINPTRDDLYFDQYNVSEMELESLTYKWSVLFILETRGAQR